MATEFRDLIYNAEGLRVAGKLPEALEQVKESLIDPRTIPDLPDNLFSDYIRQWRIFTVTGMSLAQKKWIAINARDTLLAIKPVFTTYYHHLDVIERSRMFLQDNEGHLYDHLAEMLRDVGKYWLICFYISGNFQYLNGSVRAFEFAINQAVLDDPKGIALVELGEVRGTQNDVLHRPRGSIYQSYIHQGFKLALDPVIETGNSDRLKWLLTHVYTQAERDKKNEPLATEDLLEVRKQLQIHFGEKQARIILKEYNKKELLGVLHRIIWIVTKKGVDFSKFPLSSTTG